MFRHLQEALTNLLEFPLLKVRQYNITVFDLLVLVIIFSAARLVIWAIQKFLNRRVFVSRQVDKGRQFALGQLIKYSIYLLAVLFSFQTLRIDISLLLAGSAALLVGVGLGLQQTFNDLVSGLILLFEGNVSVGDIIETNTGIGNGLVGRVTAIGIRTSKVETRDGITIIVPNSKFIVDSVTNWSHNHMATRFSVKVHTAYDADPELVRNVLMDTLKSYKEIAEKPDAFVRLNHFGDNGLEFELLFWTQSMWRIENLKSLIRFSIHRAFKIHGIVIPMPQRHITIQTTPATVGLDALE